MTVKKQRKLIRKASISLGYTLSYMQRQILLNIYARTSGKGKERLDKLSVLFDPAKTGVIMGVGADVPAFELFEEEMDSHLNDGRNVTNELMTRVNHNGT